ncbi:MAG: hypothetical protein ACD_58C00116G0002 [uncultured bacterium]|nr:MAG: hypothetical protein ACD_58C00116G0002 [uncultured bacterium]OGJ38858.1 MAG: hypothetical protein A2383_02550 [Candidatus Pacebacteria bacterium RIFOXYB1_FULL_39_46]OGJ39267.1 MAG: hypothetical protein A2182_02815 [Candidatus Pacebacteria bacterium RIFOXYA1_FULL_38_18]OGJ40946.1 MAG: hypothetical protein A2582_01480 [Candidatus Pacebacteria bacterium RIFOXYD1_FULL_39_27]OGJ41128.1 MAG: hypothetical protein A2411_01395 [Candidatus Pacebacteria bacterium RIFOXYC1_FULL_39_21]
MKYPEQKEPWIQRIDGIPNPTGQAAKEFVKRKGRAIGAGIHTVEEKVITGWGDEFNYDELSPENKQLIDWLFDTDLDLEIEFQGLKAGEVCADLLNGYYPQNMNLESSMTWIENLRKKILIKKIIKKRRPK